MSVDGGVNWSSSNSGLPNQAQVPAVVVSPADSRVLFAAVDSGNPTTGTVFRTTWPSTPPTRAGPSPARVRACSRVSTPGRVGSDSPGAFPRPRLLSCVSALPADRSSPERRPGVSSTTSSRWIVRQSGRPRERRGDPARSRRGNNRGGMGLTARRLGARGSKVCSLRSADFLAGWRKTTRALPFSPRLGPFV